jgi:hypothetical protein
MRWRSSSSPSELWRHFRWTAGGISFGAVNRRLREVLLRFVSDFTFQPAAIIQTSIALMLQEIGQLGAVATIRTSLNFSSNGTWPGLRDRDAEPLKVNTSDLR